MISPAVLLSLSALVACSSSSSTPAPAPVPVVAEPVADPRLGQWFTPPQRAQIQAAKAAFDGIKTVEDLVAALKTTEALAEMLSGVAQPHYEQNSEGLLELGWLWPHLPGMEAGYFAEGMTILLFTSPGPWAEKAAQTPGSADDDFLALVAMGYDSPSMVGWASWTVRNWDYGGCSTFGSGQHAQILQRADALLAANSPFAERIRTMREHVLRDILNTESTFAYCDVSTMAPTPPDKLQAEAQAILGGVTLTPEERAALEARMKTDFALDVIGG